MSEASLREVSEAIITARVLMHHRDYYEVMGVIEKHLGEDVLREQRQQEFAALPEAEKEKMKAARNYGIYGVFHLVSQPEVTLALSVVARELSPDFNLAANDEASLSDPATQQKIAARFPAFTPTRIQAVLQPVR